MLYCRVNKSNARRTHNNSIVIGDNTAPALFTHKKTRQKKQQFRKPYIETAKMQLL